MSRVAVVGGGIIGLACAWRLAQDGHAVVVLDAAPEAREASWAAAGMLAPHNEASACDASWRLGCASLAGWPAFIAGLGIDAATVDYRERGCLVPVVDADDAEAVSSRAAMLSEAGVACTWLDRAALASRAPALAAERALLLPGAQVHPRLMTMVLRDHCARSGVELRYGEPVKQVGDGMVQTSRAAISVDTTVIASGAWTPALAAATAVPLAGEPVKGQMLRFAESPLTLDAFIHCRHAYCVKRADQGVVVGSTMVWSGFDKTEDTAAIAQLAAGARRLLPALADVPIAETWTGLRPRLAEGRPLVAQVRDGLVIATGHFRNGILLTPITAEGVRALVGGEVVPAELTAFDLAAHQAAAS